MAMASCRLGLESTAVHDIESKQLCLSTLSNIFQFGFRLVSQSLSVKQMVTVGGFVFLRSLSVDKYLNRASLR